MIDGHVVPEGVMMAFAAGHVAHVPLLLGSNSYESGFFPARAQGLSQRYAARWPEVTAVFDGYGSHETAAVEGQLATDQLITAPTWSVARAAAAHGLPTYLYYFSYVRPSQRGHVPGASHIDEVYALFDKMSLVEKETGPDTQRIVDEVQSRWLQFARSGRPTAKAAEWPAVSSTALRVLEFTNSGPRVRDDFASARLKLADSLAATAGTTQ
jgi:para-nitrobenzyl esterase